MDWVKAKSAGVQFAFIRAHYQGGKDTKFDRNWTETKRLGIPRGAYGWVIPGRNQVTEANKFISYLNGDFGELAPVCDFEKYNGNPTYGELRTFIERVETLTGKLPYIYTSYGYWTSGAGYANQTWAAKYPLWHAQYTSAKTPTIKPPFSTWTFWQWSADGNGKGAEYGAKSSAIDLNRFNGDAIDFQKFLGADVIPPVELPDPPDTATSARIDRLERWARNIGYNG